MRVLVACEFSGAVRSAFRARGHDAWSCDLLPAEDGGPHIEGDAIAAAYGQPWDLLIAHPPCTFMANSGARHLYAGMSKAGGPNPQRWALMGEAAGFFKALWNAPVPRIAIENPIMLGHALGMIGARPSQVIQPWMFGHGETKATCLWLKGLPKLGPTGIVSGRHARVHLMPPGPDRWKERSRTLAGIAAAMAQQWGGAEVLTAEPAVDTETRDELLARALKAEQSLALAVEALGPFARWFAAAKGPSTWRGGPLLSSGKGPAVMTDDFERAREVHSKLTEAE